MHNWEDDNLSGKATKEELVALAVRFAKGVLHKDVFSIFKNTSVLKWIKKY